MQKVHRTPTFTLTVQPTVEIDAELLVIPFFEDDDLGDEGGLDAASGGDIARARGRRELTGKLYETNVTTLAVSGGRMRRAVLVGAGPRAAFTTDRLRRVAATGGLAARQRRVTSVALIHRSGTPVSAEQAAQVMAEGLTLSNFEGASYKTGELPCVLLDVALLRLPETSAAVERALERGRLLGECSNLARELANEPGNRLTPRMFAERAADLGRDAGLGVEVLDEHRIAELRMGLLLGVAQRQPGAAAARRAASRAEGTPSVAPYSVWSGRASRSTPAASRSSLPKTWTR